MADPRLLIEQLTDQQRASLKRAEVTVSEAIDEALTSMWGGGFNHLEAVNAATHILIYEACIHAGLTAKADGRSPNRDWFQMAVMQRFDEVALELKKVATEETET